MKTDAERARDARGFGDHLADHLFSAGQADRLRELVACLMPLCYLQEDALRAEHAFDEALERARLLPSPESATALIAAGETLQHARRQAREALQLYEQVRDMVLPRTGDRDLRETLEALRRDETPDRLAVDDTQEQMRLAGAEAHNNLLDSILTLLTGRGVLAPPREAA